MKRLFSTILVSTMLMACSAEEHTSIRSDDEGQAAESGVKVSEETAWISTADATYVMSLIQAGNAIQLNFLSNQFNIVAGKPYVFYYVPSTGTCRTKGYYAATGTVKNLSDYCYTEVTSGASISVWGLPMSLGSQAGTVYGYMSGIAVAVVKIQG